MTHWLTRRVTWARIQGPRRSASASTSEYETTRAVHAAATQGSRSDRLLQMWLATPALHPRAPRAYRFTRDLDLAADHLRSVVRRQHGDPYGTPLWRHDWAGFDGNDLVGMKLGTCAACFEDEAL